MSQTLDLLMTCASSMRTGIPSLYLHVQVCKVILAMYTYYHANVPCIHAVWPLFDASSLVITPEVMGRLQPAHKELHNLAFIAELVATVLHMCILFALCL